MKDDNLIDSIIRDATSEEKRIISNAQKEADKKAKSIIDAANSEAKEIAETALRQAKQVKKEKLFGYEQEAKKIILTGEKKILEQLFSEAKEELKNIKSSKRQEILKKLLMIAKKELGDDAIVYASAADAAILKSAEKGIEIKADENIVFGIIARNKDDSVVIDLTMDSLADILEKRVMSAIINKLEQH
ncbi:MAG: hypothetical protein DRN66_01040 [Candidatus Nanohalarchaeota archaeon]|nr:MAG: hypothetical protein DRN66_01040 [Candidatus Nanohaloarchaeota archaeon]